MPPDLWQEVKHLLPVGTEVSGEVLVHRPFGFFVRIDHFPDVSAVVLAPDFVPNGIEHLDSDQWPRPRERVSAEVFYYVDPTQQIRLIIR